MTGLELSEAFYYDVGEPLLKARCPDILEHAAVGLCGRGSQCLGLDDTVSRDHGWGPQFLVFLTADDFAATGNVLSRALRELPQEYGGVENRHRHSIAVDTLPWFTACLEQSLPNTPAEWLLVNENRLLEATNGRIWHDPAGQVTALREKLCYYPEPVWRSRLAQKLWQLTDSGVYNFPRALQRGHTITAHLALARFQQEVLEFGFLLNRTYAPYFKWLAHGFARLPVMADVLQPDLELLAEPHTLQAKQTAVLRILHTLRQHLHAQFLETAGIALQENYFDFWHISMALRDSIGDEEVRANTFLRPT